MPARAVQQYAPCRHVYLFGLLRVREHVGARPGQHLQGAGRLVEWQQQRAIAACLAKEQHAHSKHVWLVAGDCARRGATRVGADVSVALLATAQAGAWWWAVGCGWGCIGDGARQWEAGWFGACCATAAQLLWLRARLGHVCGLPGSEEVWDWRLVVY